MMADYQFANVLIAVLGLMTNLHLKLVLPHSMDERKQLLSPVFSVHLSIHGLKSSRNEGFVPSQVTFQSGTVVDEDWEVNFCTSRESFVCLVSLN